VKPAPFKYLAAGGVEEAIAALAEHGDEAKVLAGGQSLVPMMNLRLATPAVLVDVNRVAELSGIAANGSLELGATTRQADAERSAAVAARAPLLAEALRHVGHPGTRVRGTLGGSAAHADPAAEIPAVLLALGAELVVHGPEGERTIPADDFFVSTFTTALGPDELLTRIRLPSNGDAWGFAEVARSHGDFALAGAAVAGARIVLFGVADRPLRAREAEDALSGGATPVEAARLAAAAIDPTGDAFTSAAYRRDVAAVVVRRALEQAAAR